MNAGQAPHSLLTPLPSSSIQDARNALEPGTGAAHPTTNSTKATEQRGGTTLSQPNQRPDERPSHKPNQQHAPPARAPDPSAAKRSASPKAVSSAQRPGMHYVESGSWLLFEVMDTGGRVRVCGLFVGVGVGVGVGEIGRAHV